MWRALTLLILTGFGFAVQAQSQHSEEALEYLRLALPDTLIPHATFEIAGRDNITAMPDGSLGLGITAQQQKVNNGRRAELSINYPFAPGDRVTYRWRFRVPADFQSDAPENRWILAGQWHDQPDLSLGQTWDSFQSHSPPIALSLGGLDDRLGLVMRYGATANDERQQVTAPMLFARAVWHDVRFDITWSQSDDGEAVFTFNGQEVARLRGPNMNNAAPHYLKLGLYRHPDIKGDHWIALSDVTISHR